jgi:hypothetical protein
MMFSVSCALSPFAGVLASDAEETILLRAIVANRHLRTLSLATPVTYSLEIQLKFAGSSVFESRWSPFFFAQICQHKSAIVSPQPKLFLISIMFVRWFLTLLFWWFLCPAFCGSHMCVSTGPTLFVHYFPTNQVTLLLSNVFMCIVNALQFSQGSHQLYEKKRLEICLNMHSLYFTATSNLTPRQHSPSTAACSFRFA